MDLKPPTQLQGITDLTLFAPIKPGLVEGIFDSRSYEWRLRQLLSLLDAGRRATREAELLPSAFNDGVGRLRGIHFFRFGVMADQRLYLNVTFDGGWEPYMRLIWGPLGTLLDLIFCHSDGYPLAALSSYPDYIAWVRAHEQPSQFLYVDSGGSVADRVYLEQLESAQRCSSAPPDIDKHGAALALQPVAPAAATPKALKEGFKLLKNLYGLRPLFGRRQPQRAAQDDDERVLLRFAQDFLADLFGWLTKSPPADPASQALLAGLKAKLGAECNWLLDAPAGSNAGAHWQRPAPFDRPLSPDVRPLLQAGLLDSPKPKDSKTVTRGALVLLQVTNAAQARTWLKQAADGPTRLIGDGSTVELADDQVLCTVALTCSGLRALELQEQHLRQLPAEFLQGMEARAGILGDVRINHPRNWRRPRPRTADPAPLDLSVVDVLLQLRTPERADEQKEARHLLLPRLGQWLAAHLPDTSGLVVVADEPAWSDVAEPGEPAPRDHFRYVDGISQPKLGPRDPQLLWDDAVKTGELLLGGANDRGDGPLEAFDAQGEPARKAWYDLGSFMVVRKIRQYVQRFDFQVGEAAKAIAPPNDQAAVAAADLSLRTRLMGRSPEGRPAVDLGGPAHNNFEYSGDPGGAACPFASHVRRANPRSATPPGPSGLESRAPRIMRRGMRYGPLPQADGEGEPDRGVLFVAYNASIAEQFEVIQRWLSGGNSSGISSAQADPFVGLPPPGQSAVFRFADSTGVQRVDLGPKPISSLQWGLYAFVPPMALFGQLDALATPPASSSPQSTAPATLVASVRQVKEQFEDELRREKGWEGVAAAGGVQKWGDTVMVGQLAPLMQVLKDDGSLFSAKGYGRCMQATLGMSPFGQDDVGATAGHARGFVAPLKDAIANSVSETEAYDLAFKFVEAELKKLKASVASPATVPVDLIDLGTGLVARLLADWFGVVYGPGGAEIGGIDQQAIPVRCPGHFLSTARNVFAAYPSPTAHGLALRDGPPLKALVPQWMAAANPAPVMKAVLDTLAASPDGQALSADDRAGVVANVMLGLPATTLGSWGKLLRQWIRDRQLWRMQHRLQQQGGNHHAAATTALRGALLQTLASDPVADGIWRTAVGAGMLGPVPLKDGDIVWLGLGSALKRADDPALAEELLFGGSMDTASPHHGRHACPARTLAIGALLGGVAALLSAGEWLPTASPLVLELKF